MASPVTDMRKESFAMERLKHRLASWNREFNLSMSKADAETFLAAASALLIQRRVAELEDPF